MGVFGYRIDAREGNSGNWASLCLAESHVRVGSITVGDFNGELAIETLPSQPDGDTTVMTIPHAIITLVHNQHYQKDAVLVMTIPHVAVQHHRVSLVYMIKYVMLIITML